MATAALPLFHLYGDPPDDQAFDFIHVETIASRSSVHDWTIRAHRHRNLFQILLIEQGGGEMTFEAATPAVRGAGRDPRAADHAHGFRFQRRRDRRLGGELHRGCGRRARRAVGRGAGAAEGAGGRAGGAARRCRRGQAALRAVRRSARGALPRARRLSARDARAAGADRDRGGAACGEPRAHRQRDARAGRRAPSRRCAGWSRRISARNGCSASMPKSSP